MTEAQVRAELVELRAELYDIAADARVLARLLFEADEMDCRFTSDAEQIMHRLLKAARDQP